MRILFFYILTVLILVGFQKSAWSSCTAGYSCDERGVAAPGGEECGNSKWESLLVTQESSGRYDVTARGPSCPTCTASGRYQFTNGTRSLIGDKYGLPCSGGTYGSADHQAFLNCKGLQDDYARTLWRDDLNRLMSNSDVANAVNTGLSRDGCPVTASGITAMAHNVGGECARLWAIGGEEYMKQHGPVFNGVPSGTPPCTDAFGTNAIEKYACAMGGYDMSSYLGGGAGSGAGGAVATGCGFGFDPATPPSVNFRNTMLGCDPDLLNKMQLIANQHVQNANDIANEFIQQPVSAELATCADQRLAAYDQASKTFAQPSGGSSQFMADLQNNFKSSVGASVSNVVPGTASDAAARAYSRSVANNSGGGPLNSNCTTMDELWASIGCNPFQGVLDVSDIISNQMAEITGAIQSVLDAPRRLKDAMCNAASDAFSGAINRVSDTANDAVRAFTDPVTDRIELLDDNVNDRIDDIY